MINILKLSAQQIKTAIDLSHINETDTIDEQQAEQAYELFRSLHSDKVNKKIFLSGPDNVKPQIDAKGDLEPVTVNFFNNPHRIVYLYRWVINVLPFRDLFSEVGKLPLVRTIDNFEGYIQKVFKDYLSKIRKIYRQVSGKYKLIKKGNIKDIEGLCKALEKAVHTYFKGFTSEAFETLEKAIHDYLLPNGYLDHIMTSDSPDSSILYKMRIGSNRTYTEDEMFHIPFELRGLVNTNRYSIPGLPCIYLGSSALTCWEELGKPDLNTAQTSLVLTKSITYLDFSTPPSVAMENLINMYKKHGLDLNSMDKVYKELVSYVVVWPLMAACSIRVKHPDQAFKPEYIISQMLLQWIRKSKYTGIRYFSTKLDNYNKNSNHLYINYAFPAQEPQEKGHCPVLKQHFNFTNAVPWQVFQLYKDSQYDISVEHSHIGTVDLVKGLELPYHSTDFFKLECLLTQNLN